MKITNHKLHIYAQQFGNSPLDFVQHPLWRKIRIELISAFICLIVLRAVSQSFMSEHMQTNGSYLALACAGCMLGIFAMVVNENHFRKMQSAGFAVANFIAMFCFY